MKGRLLIDEFVRHMTLVADIVHDPRDNTYKSRKEIEEETNLEYRVFYEKCQK